MWTLLLWERCLCGLAAERLVLSLPLLALTDRQEAGSAGAQRSWSQSRRGVRTGWGPLETLASLHLSDSHDLPRVMILASLPLSKSKVTSHPGLLETFPVLALKVQYPWANCPRQTGVVGHFKISCEFLSLIRSKPKPHRRGILGKVIPSL